MAYGLRGVGAKDTAITNSQGTTVHSQWRFINNAAEVELHRYCCSRKSGLMDTTAEHVERTTHLLCSTTEGEEGDGQATAIDSLCRDGINIPISLNLTPECYSNALCMDFCTSCLLLESAVVLRHAYRHSMHTFHIQPER